MQAALSVILGLVLLTAFLTQVTSLPAQDALGPFISTVGTTSRETATGRDWAYLLWTANSPTLLNGRTHAVYAKSGDANAPTLFTRTAIVSLQTEAVTLTPLLARAAALGEDTNTLSSDIDALFGKFVSAGLPLSEKLSAVVRGALIEEQHYGRLLLLARAHPSVAMALGFGHATLLGPGATTFEIREFDRGTQSDGAVIGRVTVTAGLPLVLPAPGAPVAMPQTDARGHLNAQLRWGVPDPLRRLSLLQHGYNVWRVREDYAKPRGWDQAPPAPDALVTSARQTTAVRRINRLPLMIAKVFTAAEAANVLPPTGDTNTIFVVDDNNRGLSNVISTLDFTNGARFYYFVTARDLLGRDGAVSAGTGVQICDQLPPDALRDVDVLNDFTWQVTSNRHRLRVVWPQAPNLPLDEERIRAYWVYRWTNVTELRARQANPTNNLVAVVNHLPGAATNSYLDAGPGAPSSLNDRGETFWYTVRAEDSGACRGNLSPHSAPAFGILRDRVGPAAPTGTIASKCFVPDSLLVSQTTNGNPDITVGGGVFEFTLAGLRADRRIEWMELRAEVRPFGSTNVTARYNSGRRHFGSGSAGSFVTFPFEVPGSYEGHILYATAVAGFGDGSSASSGASQALSSELLQKNVRVVLFFAGTVQESTRFQCNQHSTVGPGGTLQPIEIEVLPTVGSKELRIYRRVDDGPLELICSRILTGLNPVLCLDDNFPHGGGQVCYFATTLDEHGNGSALTRLGCRYALETSAPPRPQLSPIAPLGPVTAPKMLLSWFCPSVNIERFEVNIAALGGEISADCAPGFLDLIPPLDIPEFQPVFPEIIATDGLNLSMLEFRRFLTPRPGGAFGEGDRFVVPVKIETGRSYVVQVRSVMPSGARSDASNGERFIWQATNAPQPQVPWPARSLPPVGNSFGIVFGAGWMLPCGETNGPSNVVVRISYAGNLDDSCPPALFGSIDPNVFIPTNSLGESLFPVVLFRRQVPNAEFPVVSGDSVQVTPMMESIAWGISAGRSVIYDPYVAADQGRRLGLFLRDTQPIIRGARYQYSLVRFNGRGEMAEVIPVPNELEVP